MEYLNFSRTNKKSDDTNINLHFTQEATEPKKAATKSRKGKVLLKLLNVLYRSMIYFILLSEH